ncbi:MAG: oligosaccharide flippase family protein [Flavobacterium sp.]|nr:oligosaccharide flippase family protein [Flavobacterium sp.]
MIKSAFWSSFDKIIFQVLNFGIAIMIARFLGPKEMGTIAIINGYVYFLNIFVDSGLTISIIRNKNITDKEVSSIFVFNFVVSLFFIVMTLLFSSFIENYFAIPDLALYLNLSSMILLFNSFAFVRYAKMEQNMQFKLESFINIFSIVASGIVCVYMLMNGYGIFGVVVFSIATSLFKNTLYIIFTPRFKLCKFNLEVLKPHLHFGKNLLLSSSVEAIYNNGFPVLITKLFTGYDAGIFFQSKRLIDGPVNLVSTSSRRLFLPIAAKFDNDLKKTNALLLDMLKLVNYIQIFMIALLFINADYIVLKLMGAKWLDAILIMKILMFGMIFYVPYFLCIDVFKVTGNSRAYSRTVLFSRLFSISLILVSSFFGFLSLVTLFSIAQLLMFLSAVYQLQSKYDFDVRAILKTIFPFLITLVAGLVIVTFITITMPQIAVLMIKTAIFALIYFAANAYIFKYNPLQTLYRRLKK